MTRKNRILISGWTAAGKTTHARLVAAELGWTYIGMSHVMKEFTAIKDLRDWTPQQDQLRRSDRSIDLKADDHLLEVVSSSSSIIVDAWLQPWLYRSSSAIRVWLDSSRSARAKKCTVSYLRDQNLMPERQAANIVHDKDVFAREQFARLYGIRFGYDPALFDLRIDNSTYIADTSISASDAGIREFQPVLMRRLEFLLESARGGEE
ncbi:cytidylate kinase family protein [Amycolatopsis sp. NBC_00438]|uniref:cytidylate kinase family protein n=1 Tax=Amycolatopsis sp. NBC_00438 TaxID=2903558 RepID=UPI002E1D737D